MQNKLSDLNNHLFAEIERLSDEQLKADELREEISRAHAVYSVASQIISNGQLMLAAVKAADDLPVGGKPSKLLE
ncbi:MAG: hypothetical protein LBD20_02515 [Spirochaetaceae bacterium]|jgi:hypothetical protein|nr:hypothetical protein [Spirochaetaceae bacterium]